MMEFEVRPGPRRLPEAGVEGAVADGAFGRVCTDHMIMVDWSADRGWYDARLEPYGLLSLPPSTSVFHYGQAVFEGMKAYRQEGGAIALFRRQRRQVRSLRRAPGDALDAATTSPPPSSCS